MSTDAGGGHLVRVVRSGGIAGMKREGQVDLDRLDAGEADEWRRLLASPVVREPAAGGRARPDGYGYRVVCESDDVDVTLPEQQLAEGDRALLERTLRR